jgi:hypothetical protein
VKKGHKKNLPVDIAVHPLEGQTIDKIRKDQGKITKKMREK